MNAESETPYWSLQTYIILLFEAILNMVEVFWQVQDHCFNPSTTCHKQARAQDEEPTIEFICPSTPLRATKTSIEFILQNFL